MTRHSLTKAIVAAGIGAGLAISAAAPAHAITRPACGDRTDFLKFFTGNHCYANSGTAADRLTSQQTVGAGNNGGFFTLSGGGDVPFEPGWGTSYATPQTVIVEHID
ncbi:hypothetical protein GTU73_16785 [Rathayibacter sp. VKM Ac-2804]|uniref:hypothetical protein n=1 Tax=Rathayibacter sp. VKM Ac-2804 TaxID=2609257 RepID=UPI00132F0394|nr:hypothetical protein [Rathayibacter sp. VKM Ac-2804]QHF25484.1 hypothetical protein GTU73_16785 [Rathayibacter sp. VKM Ac-2804]